MAEFDLVTAEGSIPANIKQNVKKKNVVEKIIGNEGEVAHYHTRDNAYETWDEACVFMKYNVRDDHGLEINNKLYKGQVIVPTCVANYLTQMDQAVEQSEIGLFKSGGSSKIINQN